MEIIKKLKKSIVGLMLASFVVVYTAPIGMCATSLPTLPQSYATQNNSNYKTTESVYLDGEVFLTKKNPLITLSLRNSDVQQVLRMFADKAGMNIIFHSSLDPENAEEGGKSKAVPTVTMDLVKVPLNEAFKMVLQVSNLTYFIDGNTIVVLSLDAAKTSGIGRQNMMVLPIKYLDASKVAVFLNTNIFSAGRPGLSNSNIAVTNPEKNEILLFGTKSDYQVAKQIVERFDVKPNEETFVVNHTTPKEMSSLICRVLFKDLAKSADDEAIVMSDEEEDEEEDDEDSDDEDDETEAVKVGEGKIACQFRSPVESESSGNDDAALSSLDTGGLTIVYFADRGSIYARGGTPDQMAQIREFITKNDRRQYQAYLEMSIVELNETGSKEFSNAWNIYTNFFVGGFSTSFSNSTPIFIAGDSLPGVERYTGAPVITYTMNYLIQNGKGRVLANPRILITSGKKASLEITSSYVKKVTSQVMDTVSSLNGAVQRTYDIGNDLGIQIELQPYISPDGYVTMNVIPSYSTIKEQISEPRMVGTTMVQDLMATLIDKRELNLKNIRIKDGETMVIGGMLKETETKTINKFPLLGDIPLIGMFFRSTSSQKEKNELVIMLTPRIIQDSIDNTQQQNKATL